MNQRPSCTNCGGDSMLREGEGWACQDPDCLRHGYVVFFNEPAPIPTLQTTQAIPPMRRDDGR